MNTTVDLKRDPVYRVFFHDLAPTISGLVVKSVFIIVDSIFTLFAAVAIMLGIGVAANMSVELGKGQHQKGQTIFFLSMLFIALSMLMITLFQGRRTQCSGFGDFSSQRYYFGSVRAI